MPDLQGVSNVFQSLNAAVMANQSVQAADMAARQGLASVQADALRREELVVEMAQAADSAEIGGERPGSGGGADPSPPRSLRTRQSTSGPTVSGAPHQRIDLIA